MKKLLFTALLIISCHFIFSQDTIIKYSGEIIQAKITEVSPTQIKYKKFNFQDGPMYVENKSDVKMIRYSNGLKEEFQKEQPKTAALPPPTNDNADYYGGTAAPNPNKIDIWGSGYRVNGRRTNERAVQKILLESRDKKIISLVGQAKDTQKLQYIGFAAIPLGLISIIALANSRPYYVATNSYGPRNNALAALSTVCFVGALACPAISSIEKHKRKNCNRAAVKLYNEKF